MRLGWGWGSQPGCPAREAEIINISQGRSDHHISWEPFPISKPSAYLPALSMEINNSVWFPTQLMWVLGSHDIWKSGRSWSQCVFSYVIGFSSGAYSWTGYSDELKPVWRRTIDMGKALKYGHMGSCRRDKEKRFMEDLLCALKYWRGHHAVKGQTDR